MEMQTKTARRRFRPRKHRTVLNGCPTALRLAFRSRARGLADLCMSPRTGNCRSPFQGWLKADRRQPCGKIACSRPPLTCRLQQGISLGRRCAPAGSGRAVNQRHPGPAARFFTVAARDLSVAFIRYRGQSAQLRRRPTSVASTSAASTSGRRDRQAYQCGPDRRKPGDRCNGIGFVAPRNIGTSRFLVAGDFQAVRIGQVLAQNADDPPLAISLPLFWV